MRAELRLVCHRCGKFYRTPVLSTLCPFCAGAQRLENTP
jgi:DNA polymerase II large subunit